MSRSLLACLSCASLATAALVPRFDNATTTRDPKHGPMTTGMSYAQSCNDAKLTYVKFSGVTTNGTTTYVNTNTYTSYSRSYEYPIYTHASNTTPYTLCDNFPRIDGYLETSTVIHSSASLSTAVSTYTSDLWAPIPKPTCLIDSADCAALQSSYQSSKSLSLTGVSSPICGLPTLTTGITLAGDPVCAEQTASLQLLYWPVTKLGGSLCGNNVSTQTMAPTISGKPNTAVFRNSTLTSPTVYMAFDGTWGYSLNDKTYSEQTGFIYPISSTAVSSLCAQPDGSFQTMSMNYGDLDGPVPASAYRCQPRCHSIPYNLTYYTTTQILSDSTRTFVDYTRISERVENQCSTIWEDDFRPALAIPDGFVEMFPSVDGCQFVDAGDAIFFDPPKALVQASSVVGPEMGPTTTAAATTSSTFVSAEPQSTIASTIPKETSTSQTTTTSRDPVQSPSSSASDPPPVPKSSTQSSADPATIVESSTIQPSTAPQSSIQEVSETASDPKIGHSKTEEADPTTAVAVSQTTTSSSQGIGEIIASVIGMTSAKTTPPSSTVVAEPVNTESDNGTSNPPPAATTEIRTTTPSSTVDVDPVSTESDNSSVNLPPAATTAATNPSIVVVPVSDGSQPSEQQSEQPPQNTGNSASPISQPADPDAGQEQATGVVLTGSQGRVITFTQPSPSGIVGQASLALPEQPTTSIAGIGNVVADSSGLVVGGTTQVFSALSPDPTTQTVADPVFTLGTNTFTAAGTSEVVLASDVTLQPAGPAVTFESQVVSLAPSGSFVVVGGSTQKPAPPAPEVTIGDQTVKVDGTSNIVLGSDVTLQPGGPVVTYSDHIVSAATSGAFVVVDGTTQSIVSQTSAASTTRPTPVGAPFFVDGSSDVILGSATLQPGGSAVIYSGHTISLATSGSYVVVDGATHVPASTVTVPTGFDVDQHTYTLDGSSNIDLGSDATLAPGSATTISGTTISLAASASYIVVNGQTADPSTFSASSSSSRPGANGTATMPSVVHTSSAGNATSSTSKSTSTSSLTEPASPATASATPPPTTTPSSADSTRVGAALVWTALLLLGVHTLCL